MNQKKDWKPNGIGPEVMRAAINKLSQSMHMPDPIPYAERVAKGLDAKIKREQKSKP